MIKKRKKNFQYITIFNKISPGFFVSEDFQLHKAFFRSFSQYFDGSFEWNIDRIYNKTIFINLKLKLEILKIVNGACFKHFAVFKTFFQCWCINLIPFFCDIEKIFPIDTSNLVSFLESSFEVAMFSFRIPNH